MSTVNAQELEEIIVTATKKEESLQDISVSVTVVDGELIEKAAINSLQDLGRYVPNFSVSENAISTIATMRGISIGANQSFEQSVGLFVDGVHMPKAVNSEQDCLMLKGSKCLEDLKGLCLVRTR